MKSTYASELFVKLFGSLPRPKAPPAPKPEPPPSGVMVPNIAAVSGEPVVYHVVPRRNDDGWNVKKEGGSRPSAVCDTKEAAIEAAKGFAHNLPLSRVVIHNKDGKISQELNYGGTATRFEPADDDDYPEETEADDNFVDEYEDDDCEDESAFQPAEGQKVIYHVTPRKKDGRWNVRRRGAEKPSKILDIKTEALDHAKLFAKRHPWSQIIVHSIEGKITHELSYGGPPEEDPTDREPAGTTPKAGVPTERITYHVTPRAEDGQWRVKRQGSKRPTRIIAKKGDAVKTAETFARNHGRGRIVIHGEDGKIIEERRFGD